MLDPFATLELAGAAFAAVYVVLAARQIIWCWPVALVSNVLMLIVVFADKLYANSLLQAWFIAMSLYGWYEWKRGGEQHSGVRVHWWPASRHAFVIPAILAATILAGWLASGTEAAHPWLDWFTATASVVATYMVARKLIENWIYWLVIDSAYIYLYLSTGLKWFAALSVFYMIVAVIGLRSWITDWRKHRAESAITA